MQNLSFIDKLISTLDQSLRTLSHTPTSSRPNPAANIAETPLAAHEQNHAASLIRVDHTGEVCAQALYLGHALTAKSATIQQQMQQAALEENDHLAWCAQRLEELNSHPSYLNPIWYTGALLMGTLAGLIGDRWNLGFVAETEAQVERHLTGHLTVLPEQDQKSRAILHQMREDETHHKQQALQAGAADLPWLIKEAMTHFARIMTTTAYYI